jgi:signal transduction histidine kinase
MKPIKRLKAEDIARLRRAAEDTAKARFQPPNSLDGLSPEASKEALYELCVYQTELEMQVEELRLTQDKLDAAMASYKELYELAPVGYCTLDERGLISQANRTASILLARPQSFFINQPITRFIKPADQDIYYLFEKDVLLGQQQQACELRMLKGDNTHTLVLLSVTVTPHEAGRRINHITMTDISKLKHTEQMLVHSAKYAVLGVMSARLVHEINQPLEIISSITENLAQLSYEPKKLEGRARVLQKAVGKIEKIVNRLNQFLKEPASQTRSRYSMANVIKKISLSSLVRSTAALMEIKAQQNKVFVTYSFTEGAIIECDQFEIEQVVTTLIANGIDAAKDQQEKWVKVEVFSVDGSVVLHVTDSGAAISDSVKTKLFQPFFSTKSDKEGLGISLSIARTILEEHKATISVLSGTHNTCFEVIFPSVD